MPRWVGASNRQIINECLDKHPDGLSVESLSQKTNLTKQQVRNIVSGSFDYSIVPLGNGRYGLGRHVFKNIRFRYTPIKEELDAGILQAEDEHADFLRLGSFDSDITIIDEINSYKL